MSASDSRHPITEVYGPEAMGDRKVRKSVRKFKARLLTADNKEKRFAISLDFFDSLQFMEWRHTSSPFKVTAKQTLLKRKIMATVLWNRCGVFSGGLNTTRNNDQLRCRLRNSKEAPKGIAKQTVQYAVKRYFAPPR
ncbi:hypothetical protein TNCV_3455991 [Trichonephila clavipes]|nr:hypothetical protein TNCV_3455991 [Trichonephila clavipes]